MGNRELPEGFKMTELGPLPEGWEVVRLGEVCEKPQYGYTASATNKPVGPKMLRITDIQDGRVDWAAVPYCQCGNKEIAKYALRPGDIVFARTGSVGKTLFISHVPEETIFASYLIRIRASQGLQSEYLYFFTQSSLYWRQIASHTHGAVQPNVNATQLKSLLLPLPPFPEQQAIAKVLRTVQRAKEATERVIAAARELKKSLMRHLFTYGPVPIDGVEGVRLKETEIGPLPEHWEVVKLGDVTEIHDKQRVPLSENERQGMRGQFPYCGANGVIDHIDQYIFDGEFVLLAEDGGYWGPFENSAYIMNGKFWVNNHAHVLKSIPDRAVNYYIMYVLNYMNIARFISGSTRGKLTQGVMATISVPLPPFPEQQKIAETLRAVDRKIQAEERRKAALDGLFRSLLHHLMTGKVRVR